MHGLFFQNGPLQIENDGNSQYIQRNNSFLGPFSVLYIDNPVGVGYSYSDSGDRGLRRNQDDYGRDLSEFMEQFVRMFPQYQYQSPNPCDVYIGGQSYAGKYVSAMGYDIHRAKEEGTSRVNLKGFYLAGPLFDSETNFEHTSDYLFSMGVLSHKMLTEQKRKVRETFSLFRRGLLANETTEQVFRSGLPFRIPGSFDNYVTGVKYNVYAVGKYMTSDKMRNALHVGDESYVPLSYTVYNSMADDIRRSAKPLLATLLDNYKVLIYNGDYDVICNTNTIEAGLLSTQWEGRKGYEDVDRFPWIQEIKIRGFYSEVDKFCRVVIHGAGHLVGIDQPDVALRVLQQFAHNGCVKSDV